MPALRGYARRMPGVQGIRACPLAGQILSFDAVLVGYVVAQMEYTALASVRPWPVRIRVRQVVAHRHRAIQPALTTREMETQKERVTWLKL